MKSIVLKFLVLITIIEGCSSWKNTLTLHGNYNDAINNAVTDFINKKRMRQDSVFSIHFMNIGDSIWGISISQAINKISVVTEDEIKYSYKAFPTRYIEKDKKLFYWKDTTQNTPPQYLVNKLYAINKVDTVIVNKVIPERIIDDALKSVHYYFCQCNLLRYKTMVTKSAMGWYILPMINCNCSRH